VDLLPQEGLSPAGSVPAYRFVDSADRTVSFEAMVTYEGSRYSVPPTFAGRAVRVSALGGQVVIRAGETVIAEHREAAEPGQCVARPEHVAELWKFTNEQVRRPPRPAPLIAAAPVQRVDLALYEEVTA
jgi:hypothetical protein